MSIVTLKTSFSSDESPWGTTYYSGLPRNRLAVPLTTIFTLPPDCNGIDYAPTPSTSSCAPPHAHDVWVNDGYYSPGVCFSGWTMGCFPNAPTVNYESVRPSETVAFCVPSDYACMLSSSRGYQSDDYATANHAFYKGIAIQIRWQSSDLSILAVAPTNVPGASKETQTTKPAAGATTTTISSTATSNLPTEAPTGISQEAASKGNSLSSGAIAGIAVGAALILLVLATVSFLMVYRRRRRRKLDPAISELDGNPRTDVPTREPAELVASEKVEKPPDLPANITMPIASELDSEIPNQRRIQELGGLAVAAPPLDPESHRLPLPDQTSFDEISASPLSNLNQPYDPGPTEQAVGDLLTRQARLEERRQRLLALEQIDQERDVIQHQLSALQQQHQHQSVKRHEMP